MRRLFSLFGGGEAEPRLIIETPELRIRPPTLADFDEWTTLRAGSRAFLEPWEPLWPADDLTRGAFRRRITRIEDEARLDAGYSFLIFLSDSGTMVGGLSLSNIRRRAAQMATLGYWMGASHAGRGIMTQAVSLLSDVAFQRLRVARIEAACIPENRASLRVLEKAGFQREGTARDYLAIAGRRRDHLLFARLATDPAPVIPALSLPQMPA